MSSNYTNFAQCRITKHFDHVCNFQTLSIFFSIKNTDYCKKKISLWFYAIIFRKVQFARKVVQLPRKSSQLTTADWWRVCIIDLLHSNISARHLILLYLLTGNRENMASITAAQGPLNCHKQSRTKITERCSRTAV